MARLLVLVGTATLLFAGCGDDNDAAGDQMTLTWDGATCTYEGPTELQVGPVEFRFVNASGDAAAADWMHHHDGHAAQDMIDYIGDEPDTKHAPSWATPLGAWSRVEADETMQWEGTMDGGVHTVVCGRWSPHGVWFGAGVTVTD